LAVDWGFSEYRATSFNFKWDPEKRIPVTAKYYRTEGLFPVETS